MNSNKADLFDSSPDSSLENSPEHNLDSDELMSFYDYEVDERIDYEDFTGEDD